MSVLVPITDIAPLVTSPVYPLPPDPSSTPVDTMQAMSHKQPVDLPVGSNRPQSAFIEEVDDEDIPVLSSSPQLISHATVQHINDPDIFDGHGPTSSSVPPPIEDPHRDLGASNSNNNSLPFLGDPEPEFFGEMTLSSISLIGVAAFKWLINVGEEVYTINIWILWPCKPSATNPLPCPLYMMSHFLLTMCHSSPKSFLRHTRTFSMCSPKKR